MPRQKKSRQKLPNSTITRKILETFHDFSRKDLDGHTNNTLSQEDANSLISVISEEDDEKDVGQNVHVFLTKQLIFSRIFLLIYQFIINKVMRDWPTDAFKGIPRNEELSKKDYVIQNFLSGLANWDSRHFLHIAEFGYTWESELAFFPLFPTLLKVFGTLVHNILGNVTLNSAMVFSGVVINNMLFVLTGLVLFRLVLKLTGNLKESIISVYIFCWNPASVFFSSLYTESVYSFITFGGLLYLQTEPASRTRQAVTSVIFSYGFLTRSNGLLNFGYICFYVGLELVLKKTENKLEFEELNFLWFKKATPRFFYLAFYFLIISLPLWIFGYAMEEKFCHTIANYQDPLLVEFAKNKSHILPGDLKNLTWCSPNRDLSFLLPSYYQHIQEKYWGVGLFGYWEFKKIPLFIMAAPTIGFIFYGCIDLFLDLAFDARSMEEIVLDRRMLFPYSLHSLILSFLAIFLYNVEVSIRMLYSSTPYIYIVIARIISRQTPRVSVPDDLLEPFVLPFLSIYARVRPLHFLMLSYILGYYFFGTMFHVNWLPYV